MDDSIRGMTFLNETHGKYEIVIDENNSGHFSAKLIKNNTNGISVVCSLNMSDIYAQCAPEKIIDRLNKDILDTSELIQTIKTDAEKCALLIDFNAPNNTPF